MEKKDVPHTYSGILLSHEREQDLVICRTWMDLDSVIQSEISRKEKKKHRILTHIDGI